MLFTIVGLLVVAYLPGAALFRAPILARDRRAALDAEERAFWAIVLSLAWSSMVVLALAAARLYTFGRLLAADAGMTACLVLAFRQRLLYRLREFTPGTAGLQPGLTLTILLPLALAALGCWLFFPPFEHVVGGQDPGVYVNEGIALAERGALVFRDSVVSSLPAGVRDLFFPSHHNPDYYSLRFMGFLVADPDRGTVVGQFPHLYPAWIAIGHGLDGVRGAVSTTPVAAILGLLAVYFAGARLLGRWPALVAGVLLALNVATIWFAREPNSDIVAQSLIFAALLAFTRAQVDRDRFFAPVSAILFGLLLFLRIESLLALAGVTVAIVLQLVERKRPPLSFVVPLLALVALAGVYLRVVLPAYSTRPIRFVLNLQPLHLALLAGGLVVLVAIAAVSRFETLAARLRWAAPRLLACVVIAAAVYAYFFRMPGGRLAWHDARSLETFTWYFPPLALLAALGGYLVVSWRSFWRDPAFVVTLTVYCFSLFYKIQIVADHFWAARRFVPMILPGACLMAAAGLFSLVPVVRRPVKRLVYAGVPLSALLLVFITVQLVRSDRPVVNHVQYAGLISRLGALAARFDANDLIVVNPRDASDIHVLAPPLNYIWSRPALVLPSPKPDKALFRQFLDWARRRYRNVYFLGGGGTDLVSRSIAFEPVFSDRFQVPEYESRRNAYPREAKWKEFDFGVYRFTRPGVQRATTFALDIGYLDDLNVYRFHAKEREQPEGVTFRWTRDASYIALPRIDEARTLTLWLKDGGRPDRAGRPRLSVYLDGHLLGTAEVSGEFRPYSFSIPGDVVQAGSNPDEAALVRLVTNTWNPRAVLGTQDDRDLGVMVHRIEVK